MESTDGLTLGPCRFAKIRLLMPGDLPETAALRAWWPPAEAHSIHWVGWGGWNLLRKHPLFDFYCWY